MDEDGNTTERVDSAASRARPGRGMPGRSGPLAPWYRCLRALGLRQRGLYCTKDTFVTPALHAGAKPAWLATPLRAVDGR
jgi:hypothetical protein